MHARSRDPPLSSPSHTLLRTPLVRAPLAGPPSGPAGPTLTIHGPKHGRTRENEPWKGGAPHIADEKVELRVTDVVDTRSGNDWLWITKLHQGMEFSKLCA
ncbi:hypothetical protein F511_13235 [Dorcoceras hygrometricum]|uniref:Uncharacterized protein n=1 Tax=Dorcoceras hygrometricum TaxID=472368 RepID=A0A2Z7D1K4_9LAMI|nr:hypothetical protein F511_13235 [Dorcoceras hygrometricum]